MEKRDSDILGMIGNTPLVELRKLNLNKKVKVLAKLESFNPGGSIKDRPALFMVVKAEERGELTREKTILEATSGNTGIGLAMIAAVKDYKLLLMMPESASDERKKILKALGGTPQPLIDLIVKGTIKGVAGIVGCNNVKVQQDFFHQNLTKELIKRDILVIGTGCWAIAAAKAGLMDLPAQELAGPGLKAVCKQLGIPPVLHMGSCVDCSRMLNLTGIIADHLKVDISDLPVVGSAPEWTTEKAVAIGTYFVGSGIPVHLWPLPPILGGPEVTRILTKDAKEVLGGWFFVEEDPTATAEQMESIIMERAPVWGFDPWSIFLPTPLLLKAGEIGVICFLADKSIIRKGVSRCVNRNHPDSGWSSQARGEWARPPSPPAWPR